MCVCGGGGGGGGGEWRKEGGAGVRTLDSILLKIIFTGSLDKISHTVFTLNVHVRHLCFILLEFHVHSTTSYLN